MSSVPSLSPQVMCFWKEREKQIPRFARSDRGMSSRGAKRTFLSSRGAKRRGICFSFLPLIIAAIPARAVAQDTGFVAWPRELASRAPALADGIAREFGQRPRKIAFGGRDTLYLLFWNPKIWRDDMDSKVLPDKSVPMVRAAMKDVAAYVWTAFGHDAGVQLIQVTFVRVVHDRKYTAPTHEQPAQELSGDFSRQMLETGQLEPVRLTIAQK